MINHIWATYFGVFWLALMIVSGMNPYGLYDVSISVYFIFGLFVFSYILGLGVGVGRDRSVLRNGLESSILNSIVLFNGRVFKLFSFLLCLVLAFYLQRYSAYLLASGFDEARSARFESGAVFASVYETILFTYLVSGSVWFAKFVVAFGFVFRGLSRFSFFTCLLACLLYLGFGGGRNILLQICLLGIFLLVIRGEIKRFKLVRRIRIYWLGSAVLVFYALSVISTFYRLTPSGDLGFEEFVDASDILFEHFIVYFTGSFRAFQYALENYESVLGLGYGRFTLGGVDEVFALLFRLLGFDTMPHSNSWGELLAAPISVSLSNSNFNALYTAVFNFYFDFGVFGVFFWGLVFGAICSFFMRKLIARSSAYDLFVCAFMFTVSMLTPLSWALTAGSSFAVLLVAYLAGGFSGRRAAT